MCEFEEQFSKLKTEEYTFQINAIIEKERSIEIDKLKIINEKIFVYVINNSIKVYNNKTFKLISILEIPFSRYKYEFLGPMKEFINVEILENDTVLILAEKKLYFYKINYKENKLNFLHYLSEIFHFCYLEKKKEIFLLTENQLIEAPLGMARSDILGNIIFYNKIKPKINYEFIKPAPVSHDTIFFMSMSKCPIHFSQFEGFKNDKFIINICGNTDNFNFYNNFGPRHEKYNISIYNTDDLKEIFNKDYDVDLRYVKLNENLFKKCYDDMTLFYYDEKENKINFIKNLDNENKGIYKYFDISLEEEFTFEYGDVYKENSYYFNLYDNSFGIFSNSILYIIDLSSKNIIKKIKIDYHNKNKNNYERFKINNLKYLKLNGKEYLYFSVNNSKIIFGEIKN